MVVNIIIGGLMAVMGIVILAGKGDKLIAGYNTASKEEREKVNVKRLRLLIGGFLMLLGLMYGLLVEIGSTKSVMGFGAITLVLAFVVIALANSWAMKK